MLSEKDLRSAKRQLPRQFRHRERGTRESRHSSPGTLSISFRLQPRMCVDIALLNRRKFHRLIELLNLRPVPAPRLPSCSDRAARAEFRLTNSTLPDVISAYKSVIPAGRIIVTLKTLFLDRDFLSFERR